MHIIQDVHRAAKEHGQPGCLRAVDNQLGQPKQLGNGTG